MRYKVGGVCMLPLFSSLLSFIYCSDWRESMYNEESHCFSTAYCFHTAHSCVNSIYGGGFVLPLPLTELEE